METPEPKTPAPTPRPSPLILILTGLLASKILLYILLIPPWQVPDEPTHFEYIYVLSRENHAFASVEPDLELQEQILKSMADYRFWTYLPFPEPATPPKSFAEDYFLAQAPGQIHYSPPLYHALGSRWLRLFSPGTLLEALYLLRLYSALLAVGFFLTIVKLVRWAIPDDAELQVGAICFVAFLPQFGFIGGGVNNDNLISLLYAATVIAGAKVATKKSLQWIGLLFLLVIACVLTKKTGLAAIPLAVVSLICSYEFHRRKLAQAVFITVGLFGALLLAQAFLTWFSPETAEKVIGSVYYAWTRLAAHPSIGGEMSIGITALTLWRSFWASFGWMRVGPPPWLYLPTLAVHAAMAAGAIVALWEVGGVVLGKLRRETARVRTMISVSGILILAAVILRNLGEFLPQGRYLLPALPALALWLALGMSLAPQRARRWLVIAFVGWFCFFELATLFGYTLPLFYKGVL